MTATDDDMAADLFDVWTPPAPAMPAGVFTGSESSPDPQVRKMAGIVAGVLAGLPELDRWLVEDHLRERQTVLAVRSLPNDYAHVAGNAAEVAFDLLTVLSAPDGVLACLAAHELGHVWQLGCGRIEGRGRLTPFLREHVERDVHDLQAAWGYPRSILLDWVAEQYAATPADLFGWGG